MANAQQYRMTRQRRLILEEVRQMMDSHPSADEVYDRVRQHLPRISLGTVYRNLETLFELGEIQKLEYGGTLKRFDGDPSPHYHIRCTCCDRVDNVPFDPFTDIEQKIADRVEFKILGHHLEFFGLCLECSENMLSPGLKKANLMACSYTPEGSGRNSKERV